MANLDRISAQPWDARAQRNQIAPRSLTGGKRAVMDQLNQRREAGATIATTARGERMSAQRQAEQMLATYESGQRPDQALDPKIIALWGRVNELSQDPEWKDAITDLVTVFGDLLVESSLNAKSPQSLSSHALQVFEQALNAVSEWKALYSPHIPIGPGLARDFVNPDLVKAIMVVWERSFASANRPALALTAEPEASGRLYHTRLEQPEAQKVIALLVAMGCAIALVYLLLTPQGTHAQENVGSDLLPPVPVWLSNILHADAVLGSLGLPLAPDLKPVLETRSMIQEKMEQSRLQQRAMIALKRARLLSKVAEANGRIMDITDTGEQLLIEIALDTTNEKGLVVSRKPLSIEDANTIFCPFA